MLGQLDELIYDAVCAEQECVLFLSKGRRLVDVQRGTLGALIPWPEGDDSRPSFIGGKPVAQPGKRTLYFISTEGVFYSPDFGAHWRQTLDLPAQLEARQLLGFERGEEDSPTANASGKRKSMPGSLPPLMAIACCSG